MSAVRITHEGAYPRFWGVRRDGVDTATPMLHSELAEFELAGPFRLMVDGPDGTLTRFANTATYTVEDDTNIFTSSVHESGLEITKRFHTADDYSGTFEVEFSNKSDAQSVTLSDVAVTLGPGLGIVPGSIGGLGDAMYSYVEAFTSFQDRITPIEFDDESDTISVGTAEVPVEMVGMHNRYYVMFVRDDNGKTLTGRTTIPRSLLTEAEVEEEAMNFFPAFFLKPFDSTVLPPGESISIRYAFYMGPKLNEPLEKFGGDAILYSNLPRWMRWLCLTLGDVLKTIYGVVGSWWLTLLVLTVFVRILLFPMAQKAIKMNAQMLADQAKLKPLIDEIKAKHSDAQVQYKKTMELYKENGINPFAPMLGCLPIIVQLPILIAIFNILGQEIEMQGARFLWINDLSIPDQLFPLGFTLPYFGAYFNLLPLLMAVTMVLTTNLGTPAEGDQKKSQLRSMVLLAALFFTLFYSFPAGLVLYWMMSNIGQYIQQEIVTRRVNAKA